MSKKLTIEKQLQKENTQHKYIPNIKFEGSYECFLKIIKNE